MDNILKTLHEDGFIFLKYPSSFLEYIDDTEFFAIKLSKYISTLLSIEGESLIYDIDTIRLNEEIRPHYHIIPGTFQVVVWLPRYKFTGRYFIYGKRSALKKVVPELGYMAFMLPNNPNFIHGVTPLQSQDPVQTIGFSSLIRDIPGNRDIFVEDYSLTENVLIMENIANSL